MSEKDTARDQVSAEKQSVKPKLTQDDKALRWPSVATGGGAVYQPTSTGRMQN